MSNKLGIFLAGGVAGAAVALLCAPRTGEEARTLVAEKVNAAWGQAQNIGADAGSNAQHAYQNVAARGQEVVSNVQARGQEVAGQAAARVQEVAAKVKPSFTQDNDELREKIEAARQRIANQVAKNAEESGEAAEEPVEVAAEAVEPEPEVAADAEPAPAAEERSKKNSSRFTIIMTKRRVLNLPGCKRARRVVLYGGKKVSWRANSSPQKS